MAFFQHILRKGIEKLLALTYNICIYIQESITMSSDFQRKKTFYCALGTHFFVEEYATDTPRSMPNFHYHNQYEIYYLKHGQRYYFINDDAYAVDEGSFVIVDKNDIHCTGTLGDSGYERVLVYFDDYFLEAMLNDDERDEILACFSKRLGPIKLPPEKKQVAELLIYSMLSEFKNSNLGRELYMKAALIQLLCIIANEGNRNIKNEDTSLNAPQRNVSKIVGYINNNYFEDITLEGLSESFFISPYYLSRKFKSLCGMSLVDYLNNVRIKEAKKLLIGTKMSITEISSAVGYRSNTHFGRTFKKITTLSPLAYRKMHIKKCL